jgi:photosystem II stability/assembly factor-like uncharacterized protein
MKQLLILLFLPAFAFTQIATTGAEKLTAFKQHQLLLQQSPYKNIQWRLAGPNNRSGRSTDVAGITGNPNIMYAAYATGGLWKTEDAGETWKPIFDKEATQSIGNIALAASNPDILYVGTGEANIFRASVPGTGIYRSANGGKSFTNIGLANSGTIARIVVHPKDPNVVFVAAAGNEWTYNRDRGVYMTTNGGKTWKNILFVNNKTGCIDLVMDPSHPNTLYASMWNRVRRRWSDPVPEEGDYIYKTSNGGKTWKIINSGLPDTKLTGRVGLAISNSNPNVLYAFVDDHNKKRDPKPGETDSYQRKVQKVVIGGEVFRSNDKGESWQKMAEIHDFFTPFSGTYGWVFSQVRVDPKDENEVYVMGVNIGRSEDGGKTWKQFGPSDKKSDYIHGDNHAMWFDKENPDRMMLGNDGGVSYTNDGGKIWRNTFSKIPTTQFYNVTYDMAKPFNLFGSIQDEGTFSGNVTNSFGVPQDSSVRSWNYAPGGEGTRIQVDPINPNIIFSSQYYGMLMKSDMSKPQRDRSKRISDFAVGAIDSLRGEWLAGTLISKFDNKVIYHGLQHLYRSTDGGDTWKIISPDLSYNDKSRMGNYPYLVYHQAITTIAEGNNAGELYVGTDDGRLWNSSDDGKTWKEISNGLPYNKHVAHIETSSLKDGKLYVVLNDRRADNATPYIFVSDNSGATWRSVTGNLPASPANVIIEDDRTGNLFCGTDLGIYISKDAGKKWNSLNANMPASVSVQDMFIHPRDKKLVIATYGRGVYVLDDMNVLK